MTPLVLLHGIGASRAVWDPVLALLAVRAPIALALPGHRGGPAWPTGLRATVETVVDGVCTQLDAAGIQKAHIVGNSLGGWVALELARRGRAASVVALSPAGGWRTDRDARNLVARLASGGRAGNPCLVRRLVRLKLARGLFFASLVAHPERIDAGEAEAILDDLAACSVLNDLLETTLERGPIRSFDVLPSPTLIAWGGRDRTLPFKRYGRPLVDSVNGSEFVTIPGVGHVPMGDEPELVAQTILRFIEQVEAVTRRCPSGLIRIDCAKIDESPQLRRWATILAANRGQGPTSTPSRSSASCYPRPIRRSGAA